MTERLYTVEELADILNIHKLSVYRMIKAGKINPVRLPLGRFGVIRVSSEEIKRFLSECRDDLFTMR